MTSQILLHQTYKDSQPSRYDKFVETWTDSSLFERIFYSDQDLDRTIAQMMPERLAFFRRLRKIEKIDYIRYVLMYTLGGVYADMDLVLRIPAAFQHMFTEKQGIYFGIEKSMGRYTIAQAILISPKAKEPFWLDFLNYIETCYDPGKYITYTTGPDILTAFIKQFSDKYDSLVFDNQILKSYTKHIRTGSWREDAFLDLDRHCLKCRQLPDACLCYSEPDWYTQHGRIIKHGLLKKLYLKIRKSV